MNSLISIIIPSYNRANLLGETLDSILNQSCTVWECIVIDDRSTDYTNELMEFYCNLDKRIQFYIRPENLNKGANSCRNFGFLKSRGTYIKWFDSDDIMLPKHLEIARNVIIENELDFVVTDTLNFDNKTKSILNKPYNFDREKVEITDVNLALNKIGWITDDFMGTFESVKNIKFNEHIIDGDEYNFFIKFLQQNFKGNFINDILVYRRIHKNCITIKNKENENTFLLIITSLKYQTAKDLVIFKNKKLIKWFLSGYMQNAFKLSLKNETIPHLLPAFKLVCNYFSIIKGFLFIISILGGKYLNKGYNILKYARN